jgi:hypothetical protein
MADRYVRDNLGRFAPTGRTRVTGEGRVAARLAKPTVRKGTQKRVKRALKNTRDNRFVLGSARGISGRTRNIEGKRVFESDVVKKFQKGKVNSAGAVAIQRGGYKLGPKGTVKRTNVNSVVLKLKKNGYSKNGPTVGRAIYASAARGVPVGANARYVSGSETRQALGGTLISRARVARASATGRPPGSGYLVINSLQQS